MYRLSWKLEDEPIEELAALWPQVSSFWPDTGALVQSGNELCLTRGHFVQLQHCQ